MTTILLGFIAGVFFVIAIFLIPLIIELKRTIMQLRISMEEKLNPALDELQMTLKSLRNISDNVTGITADVKSLSKSVSDVGQTVSLINGLISNFSSTTAIKIMSLRSGIMAGIGYLLTNLIKKGDRK